MLTVVKESTTKLASSVTPASLEEVNGDVAIGIVSFVASAEVCSPSITYVYIEVLVI